MLENEGETEISKRYQIRKHLGTGGSGDAYLAWDTSPASTEIDAKAIRDMDRVVRYLSRSENRNKKVFLLGFSDSSVSFHPAKHSGFRGTTWLHPTAQGCKAALGI